MLDSIDPNGPFAHETALHARFRDVAVPVVADILTHPDFKETLREVQAEQTARDARTAADNTNEILALLKSSFAEKLDLEGALAAKEKHAAHLAEKLELAEGLILGLAENYLPEPHEDIEAAVRDLEAALDVATRNRHALPGNADAAVNEVIKRIDALNDARQIDEGWAEFNRALAEFEDEDARRAQAKAQLLDKGIAQAIFRADAEGAADLIVRQVVDEATDHETRFAMLRKVQDDYYERGRDKGVNFDLEIAIALSNRCLALAHSADERGTAGNDLGLAIWELGDRESGTDRLEEAVSAYRAALEERTRDRVPMAWATTQMNLGNALLSLGKRESGTDRLEEAVSAYRAALEERTRDRVPLDWAMAQMNLGTALGILGARESGTVQLEEAVTAFRAALEEYTRDRVPMGWAAIQMNLGNALLSLGERGKGTDRLAEVVTAYSAGLEEYTRDRVPLDWAMTNHNLAGVFLAFFDKTGDPAHLDTAQSHLDAAREVVAEAGASHYLELITKRQAAIDARRKR